MIFPAYVDGDINIYQAEIFDHERSDHIPREFAKSCSKLRKGNTLDIERFVVVDSKVEDLPQGLQPLSRRASGLSSEN